MKAFSKKMTFRNDLTENGTLQNAEEKKTEQWNWEKHIAIYIQLKDTGELVQKFPRSQ